MSTLGFSFPWGEGSNSSLIVMRTEGESENMGQTTINQIRVEIVYCISRTDYTIRDKTILGNTTIWPKISGRN